MERYYIFCIVLLVQLSVHGSYEELLPNLKITETRTRSKMKTNWKQFPKRSSRKSIVTDSNIEDMRQEMIHNMEMTTLIQIEEIQKNKEKQKLKQYIDTITPQLCRYIYDSDKYEIKMDLKTITISVRKTHLLQNNHYIPLLDKSVSNQDKPQIFLGTEVMLKFRKVNSLCLGRILFEEGFFNSKQIVHFANLYKADNERSALDTTNMKEFGILVDLPYNKIGENPKCSMLTNNAWDPSKCVTLSLSPTIIKCGCKTLGYFTVLLETNVTATTTTTRSNSVPNLAPPTPLTAGTSTTRFTTPSTVLSTLSTIQLVQVTPSGNIGITTEASTAPTVRVNFTIEQVDMQDTRSTATVTTVALISIIVVLSICIISILSIWAYVYIRNKKRNAVNTNTVSYGRYYDEHTLDSFPTEIK